MREGAKIMPAKSKRCAVIHFSWTRRGKRNGWDVHRSLDYLRSFSEENERNATAQPNRDNAVLRARAREYSAELNGGVKRTLVARVASCLYLCYKFPPNHRDYSPLTSDWWAIDLVNIEMRATACEDRCCGEGPTTSFGSRHRRCRSDSIRSAADADADGLCIDLADDETISMATSWNSCAQVHSPDLNGTKWNSIDQPDKKGHGHARRPGDGARFADAIGFTFSLSEIQPWRIWNERDWVILQRKRRWRMFSPQQRLTHPYRIEFVFLVTSALRWSRWTADANDCRHTGVDGELHWIDDDSWRRN